MVYKKTIWKDGIFEKPRNFKKQDNVDGTFTLIPAFGKVLQEGTKVNADVMNNIENGIESIEKKVEDITSPVTSVNGKTGKIVLSTNDIKTTDGRTVEKALYDLADGKQDKVVIAEKTPTNLPSTYPLGYSTFYTSSSAWKTSCGGSSISSAYAVVETCHAKLNYGITQKITWFNSSHNVLSKMERASYSQSAWGAWSNIPTGIDISGVTKIEVVNGILRIHY